MHAGLTPALGATGLSWNLGDDIHQLFALHFMVNAFRAGTVVAVIAGAMGWFMVLRRQSFAGHTLAVVSFPGAAGAILIGVSATAGYFAGAIAAALVIALVPRSAGGQGYSQESAVIGTVQAFALACGVLFVSLYGGFLDSLTGVLFGTFLGISNSQVVTLALVAVGALAVLALIARPLFFSTIDPDVGACPRCPVRLLSVVLPRPARLRRGRGEPDHRRAPRVRPPGDARRGRPAAHRSTRAQLCPHDRPGVGDHLAGTGRRVLLHLPGGLLHHHLRLRRLRPRRRGAGDRAPSGQSAPNGTGRAMMLLVANPFVGIDHMFEQPYLRYAFVAGTAISLASGLVGYFVVLRGQVFTGDALSHVAVTGALAALAAGIGLLVGLYAACVVMALVMAALGTRGRADDTVIGSVFAWILGLGALFLTVYTTSSNGTNGTSGINVLFGSIFGLSRSQTIAAVAVTVGVVVSTIAIARPLLFASIDDAVASARQVPVRLLGYFFLTLVGLTAAAATQAVGALLLLGLLAAPAGAAQRLTARPFRAMWLSGGIAVVSMWVGLSIAYAAPQIPPSFSILAVATTCYVLAFVVTAGLTRLRRFRAPGRGEVRLSGVNGRP